MSDIRVRHLKNADYCDFCLETWPCDAICEADRADRAEAFAKETDSARWNRMKIAENAQDDLEAKLKAVRAQAVEMVKQEKTRAEHVESNLSDTLRLLEEGEKLSETGFSDRSEWAAKVVTITDQPWAQAILKENK